MMDVQRVIEVWISKVGDAPAEVFYSAHIYMGTRSRHKTLPAIVSAAELMAAQVHALMVFEAEAEKDPVAAELLRRGRRLETKVIEGPIKWTEETATRSAYYDVVDPNTGASLQATLDHMQDMGSKVARVVINDPDNLR